jgi:hypothetical protein
VRLSFVQTTAEEAVPRKPGEVESGKTQKQVADDDSRTLFKLQSAGFPN